MERVKIDMPGTFVFSTVINIRITDLNYGGHVGNDTFLTLIHEARQQFLLSIGFSELSFGGYGLILADAMIEYKKELAYGDAIKISVTATGFEKYGFDLYYRLEVVTDEAPVLAAKAKTGMLCFDYAKKRLAAIPLHARESFRNAGM